MTKSEQNVSRITSTLKPNEAAMINANATDAKGITNDPPLSLQHLH